MRKIIVMSCIAFATAFQGLAQNNNPVAVERANRLTDQMIRDLQLNNFQANRLRAINQDKINKMIDIEQKYANDLALVDQNCKGVCKERDKELLGFLSTDQYSKYYGSRNNFYKYDKDFAAKIGLTNTATAKKDKVNLPIGEKAPVVNTSNTVLKQTDAK